MKRLIVVFLALVLWHGSSFAMDIDLAAAVSGKAADVSIFGNTAYIADGYGLWILDASDPQNMTDIGHWGSPGLSESVIYNGDVCYVCDGQDGLQMVDITNPANPEGLGSVSAIDAAYEGVIVGSYLYVAAGQGGLVIFDITNPIDPVYAGEVASTSWVTAVDVENNTAALATETGGILLADVTDPLSTTYLSTIDLSGTGQGVIIDGTTLLALDRENGCAIYDITDPENPARIGGIITGGWSTDILLDGDDLYIVDWFSGVSIYDISNISSPSLEATADPSGFVTGCALDNDLLLLAIGDEGIEAWDVTTTAAPEQAGSENPAGSPQDVRMTDTGFIYEAAGDAGLRVWEDDFASGQPTAEFDTPGWANSVSLSESWIYLADGFQGMRIYELNTTPVEAFHVTTDDYAGTIAINGNDDMFISQGGSGFLAMKVEGLSQPEIHGTTTTEGFVHDISVSSDLVVTCEGANGIEIFDISDPTSPQYITTYSIDGGAWSVLLLGTTLYVGAGSNGIEVYNLSDPSNPALIGSNSNVGWVEKIRSAGYQRITACSGSDGVFVLDIAENEPVVFDFFDSHGLAKSASTQGLTMVLADEYDLSLFGLVNGLAGSGKAVPTQYTLSGPYPNPFNPATQIALSLATADKVELRIYDLLGRQVANLWSGDLTSGQHQFAWIPGSQVASGMYYVSMKVGSKETIKPLVFLK